jgi:outer membrane protein assembly factor BamA
VGCREEGDIQIHKLDFEGVKQVDKTALANALQTKRGSRLPWGHKTYFDRRMFDADLERIQAFYRDRGFPDARVASFDVKLNDTQDQVDVVVRISEGEPTLVAGIDLTGFDVLSEGDQRNLRDSLPLQPKRPLDRQLAVASRERALNALRDHGYPYAEVNISQQGAGDGQVQVAFAATPGTLAHFGPVQIDGQKSVDDIIIRRQLTYQEGDIFSRREMRESQRKLYRMELFQFANIESQEDKSTQSPDVPTRVAVAEAKHQRLTTGIGYGSEEHARRDAALGPSQFLRQRPAGRCRNQMVVARSRCEVRLHRAVLSDRPLLAQFREPRVEGDRTGLFVAIARRPRVAAPSGELAELLDRVLDQRVSAQRHHQCGARRLQHSRRSDCPRIGPAVGHDARHDGAIAFDVNRNTTNNLLDANQGYVLSGHVEQAGKWLWGTYNYWEVSGEARQYTRVGRSFVWANRIHAGTIDALGGDASVPFFKRYFLGGASSVRGWGRFEVSPLSGFGLPIGGLSMVEGSTEIRKPLFGKLGGVAFFDFGNVSDRSLDVPRTLVYAVGPGLRYLTPVGPARIDFGYQLNRIDNLRVNGKPETRNWRIHFSIGQAF